jgi:hypothetical protein
MPTIKARKQANGQTRYTAIVRIRRAGVILHRESRTFTHRSAAITWAKLFSRIHPRSPASRRERDALGTHTLVHRLFFDRLEVAT